MSTNMLPKFEFCYETIIHNKILSNHVLLIPEGEISQEGILEKEEHAL
jgi:hypothetical protein